MNTTIPTMKHSPKGFDRKLTAADFASLVRLARRKQYLVAMRRSTWASLREALLSPIEAQSVIDQLTRRINAIDRELRRLP